jgi:hypothetical protein
MALREQHQHIEFLNSYVVYHMALRQQHQHIEFLNLYIIYHRALRQQHQHIPYDIQRTSLETLYVGAALLKPYDI